VVREFVIRAVLGGVLVCLFSVLGEAFKPKSFSGLFGAAPSVAIASLALAFAKDGAGYVRIEARSMLPGAAALFVYGALCVVALRRRHFPVWLAAIAAWGAWLVVAFCAWRVGTQIGLLG
jgi:uncharacterized membrane protein (GlpM family)